MSNEPTGSGVDGRSSALSPLIAFVPVEVGASGVTAVVCLDTGALSYDIVSESLLRRLPASDYTEHALGVNVSGVGAVGSVAARAVTLRLQVRVCLCTDTGSEFVEGVHEGVFAVVEQVPHSDMLICQHTFRAAESPFNAIFYAGVAGASLASAAAAAGDDDVVEICADETDEARAAAVSAADAELAAWDRARHTMLEEEEDDDIDILHDRAADAAAARLPTRAELLARVCSDSPDLCDALIQIMYQQRKIFTDIDATGCNIEGSALKIEIDPGVRPFNVGKPRMIHPNLRAEVKEILDTWVRLGVVEPVEPGSKAMEWGHPLVVAFKPNGKLRVCIDCTALNKHITPLPYTMPRIEDIAVMTKGKRYFSTLDLISGFHQIQVHPSSRHFLAFHTPFGSYRYARMPFGVSVAPLHFQQLLEQILAPLIERGVCCVYCDDILLCTATAEEHAAVVQQALRLLEGAGLRINLAKCRFGYRHALFIGCVFDGETVKANPTKIAALCSYPKPGNKDQLVSFLALCQYFQRYIPDFVRLAEPLRPLVLPHVILSRAWGPEHDAAFHALRSAVISNVLLHVPDFSRPLYLRTDACDIGCGGVLFQLDDDGNERYIHFLSHRFTPAERRWNVTERECFGVKYCVAKLEEYLRHAPFKLEVDHANLKFMRTSHNAKVQRWFLYLLRFRFEIAHIRGVDNVVADALSRLHVVDDADAATVNVLADLDRDGTLYDALGPDESISGAVGEAGAGSASGSSTPPAAAASSAAVVGTAEAYASDPDLPHSSFVTSRLLAAIIRAQQAQPETVKRAWRKDAACRLVNIAGIPVWAHRSRVIVPTAAETEWADVLRVAHDESAHPGVLGTLQAIHGMRLWREDLQASVAKYVHSCILCQRNKGLPLRARVGDMAYVLSVRRWDRVVIDIVGPFVTSKSGYKFVLVAVDSFTRWSELRALKAATAQNVVAALTDICYRHGLPCMLQHDPGSHFTARCLQNWCIANNVQWHVTSTHHPQSNGKAETICGRTVTKLKLLCDTKVESWDALLPQVQWQINSTVNSSIGMSPYCAMHGEEPRTTAAAKAGAREPKSVRQCRRRLLLVSLSRRTTRIQCLVCLLAVIGCGFAWPRPRTSCSRR
jgi:transposase InsO family protein